MLLRILLYSFLAFLLSAGQAWSQSEKTFAVLPFEVHGPQEYQYLAQGIQSMLSSRLTRAGQSSSIPAGQINQRVQELPHTTAQAQEIRSMLGADYIVYGNVTIMDREASLDVFSASIQGPLEPILKQPSLSELIPSLEQVASSLLSQALPEQTVVAQEEVVADTPAPPARPAEADVFVSPHFRFEDDPYAAGRWRSQTLSFSSVGIALGSSKSSGTKTIFILGDRHVHAYRLQEGRMMPVDTYEIPLTYQPLNINAYDINRDGNDELIISAMQDERARSLILKFENDEFTTLHQRIPFYMNIVMLPPHYRPAIIGQRPASGSRLFNPNSVQEVIMTSDGPELGPRISLPPNANVFNFTYFPQDDDHLIVLAENDILKVYSSTHNLRYSTTEEYAGSRLGIEIHDTMPGLGRGSDVDPNYYYIPTRLLPARIGDSRDYTLLVHKHFAGMTRIFARHRNFPEGEIRAMFWDDIGLNVHWNTRKIRAGIMDFGLFDFDGDGQKDLVVLVNTHPGITGLQDRGTIVLAYKLDSETMGRREQ